jgi:hypothetical protein
MKEIQDVRLVNPWHVIEIVEEQVQAAAKANSDTLDSVLHLWNHPPNRSRRERRSIKLGTHSVAHVVQPFEELRMR